ncbi:hypothetical protein SCLCIDRAFT_1208463 [Scleroderma citrinum Foug A]|uniref:Uncharacterized protein n=1 Tax=Scleroderma citrinum Foug A TaxID=1036808 RepID=A0A0C3AVR3_9AGAM|nr:hypothetical protein SCLCIDRAFT_1208463 [Scleroderma citrinum Foug A]
MKRRLNAEGYRHDTLCLMTPYITPLQEGAPRKGGSPSDSEGPASRPGTFTTTSYVRHHAPPSSKRTR